MLTHHVTVRYVMLCYVMVHQDTEDYITLH